MTALPGEEDAPQRPRIAHTRRIPGILEPSFLGTGVTTALAFFALSLQPSLLPRSPLFQGVVSALLAMVGYGAGCLAQWTWEFLELPEPRSRRVRSLLWGITFVLVLGVLTVSGVWRHVGWQNEVRRIFGMDPAPPTVWITIVFTTVLLASAILIGARLLRRFYRMVTGWLHGVLPRRPSLVVGAILVVLAAWWVFSGVMVNALFAAANGVFSVRDSSTERGVEQPASPYRSGSPESSVPWDTLGRMGRSFVAGGATIDDLDEFSGGGAIEPIRVYVGLESADSLEERAALVLEELKRTGAFDRSILLVATTTGTGWVDSRATDPLEFVFNGDTAIVGVQYSYLPSSLSLLADQDVAEATARVVFDTIHDHWSNLPEASRPRIFLFGLSLGSLGVESILTSIGIINAPIDGALLAGPTFLNQLHRHAVANRDPGSPPWLPVFERGRTVRFTSEVDALGVPAGPWGPTRIAYLQHPTDPIVFFSPDLAFRRPDWLRRGQRSPEIPAQMGWIPVVTMGQVAIDIVASDAVPVGYGHRYSPAAYIDSWIGLTEPPDWDTADTHRLKAMFAEDE